MVFKIIENELLFNDDGSTNPPYLIVDENNTLIFWSVSYKECEDYIQANL